MVVTVRQLEISSRVFHPVACFQRRTNAGAASTGTHTWSLCTFAGVLFLIKYFRYTRLLGSTKFGDKIMCI